MQQERRKLFRRQSGHWNASEVRQNMAFQHETVTLPCGEFDIGLKQILRKKLFQRQLTRSRAFVCQRLHCCQLLLLCNIVRPPIDRLVFCLAIWQAHGDIPRFPAAILAAIDVLSVLRHTQPFLCTRIVTANTRQDCLASNVMHLHNTVSYFLCHKIC